MRINSQKQASGFNSPTSFFIRKALKNPIILDRVLKLYYCLCAKGTDLDFHETVISED